MKIIHIKPKQINQKHYLHVIHGIILTFIIITISNNVSASTIPTTVTIKPSIGLNLPTDTVVLDLDPTTNPFDSETISISVGTNNRTGYSLIMSADNTELVNTVDNTKTIPTLVSSTSESNFPANHWGYRISTSTNTDTNYLPFSSGTTINSKSTKINNDITNFTLASKVDYLQVAGSYKQTFTFKALPNITTNYMQNLDPTLCTEEPMLVVDSRDEQIYTVRRLADGKCWMLDNLNLDLTDETVVSNLTTANTNIDTENDPYALESLKNGARDKGDKYATAGLEYHNWTGSGMTPVSPDYSYDQPLVNRDGRCNPNKNGSYPCVGKWQNSNYTDDTVIDVAGDDNKKYNYGLGSYKIGTYYNYCAASAGAYCYGNGGKDSGTPSGDATSDICPAGWHMPTDNGGSNGDYLTLCSAIVGGTGCSGYAWNTMAATDATSMQYQLSLPMSGVYNAGTAYLLGGGGIFWSSTYYDDARMYYLYATSSGVYPLYSHNRDTGRSVRCLLQE